MKEEERVRRRGRGVRETGDKKDMNEQKKRKIKG